MLQKLYLRIWLAIVLTVAMLSLLVGMVWRMATEPPLRVVVVRNTQGDVIGGGSARALRPGLYHHDEEGHDRAEHAPPLQALPDGAGPSAAASAPIDPNVNSKAAAQQQEPDDADEHVGHFGRGPEFVVRLQDGQTMHLHLPRPPRSPWIAPFGFFGALALVAAAVALATDPIVRRLTRRLESLQTGVFIQI